VGYEFDLADVVLIKAPRLRSERLKCYLRLFQIAAQQGLRSE